MEIKVGNYTVDKWNETDVTLTYDSIADAFSFKAYYDPSNAAHRKIFRPGSYHTCTVKHNGLLLITGTLLSTSASDGAVAELSSVSGYSLSGILEDVSITNSYSEAQLPTQFNGLSLKEIATQILSKYRLKLIVDETVRAECEAAIPQANFKTSSGGNPKVETIKTFLDDLCKQKNVILSHDQYGNVLMTRPKANKITRTTTVLAKAKPVALTTDIAGAENFTASANVSTSINRKSIYHFDGSIPEWKMSMQFDGQKMHAIIQVVGQQSGSNAQDDTVFNPYAFKTSPYGTLRSKLIIQTAGNDNETKLTARRALGEELKNIVLTIEIDRWELNGKLVRPNQLITATNPRLHMDKPTRWFIREVAFTGDTKSRTATLTCVLPECYNDDEVKNIFL